MVTLKLTASYEEANTHCITQVINGPDVECSKLFLNRHRNRHVINKQTCKVKSPGIHEISGVITSPALVTPSPVHDDWCDEDGYEEGDNEVSNHVCPLAE